MKQKMSDLEVLLLETRREADEYQKAIIERNADVADLERKVITTINHHHLMIDYLSIVK